MEGPAAKKSRKSYDAAKEQGGAEEGDSFVLSEIKGDLFGCDASDSLAHCVSEDMAMGKGIAVLFKNKFKRVRELKAQRKRVGQAACISRSASSLVFYLVTKAKYYHKPTLESLEAALRDMRSQAEEANVRCIAMPRIGCGLDRLRWAEVRALLERVFQDSSSVRTIKVYYL